MENQQQENSGQSFVNEEQDQYDLHSADEGYALLARGFLNSSTHSMGMVVRDLAVHLILWARHKRYCWYSTSEKKSIWIERGEILKSQAEMIRLIGDVTPRQFRTAWSKLIDSHFMDDITPSAVKTTHRYTHVKINKYNSYQNPENYQRHTSDIPATYELRKKEGKQSTPELFPTSSDNNTSEVVNTRLGRAKEKRGCKIPFTELTAELKEVAEKIGLNGRSDIEFQKFLTYWQGCGKTKIDWKATWRNWCLNAVERSGSNNSSDVNKVNHVSKFAPGTSFWDGVK